MRAAQVVIGVRDEFALQAGTIVAGPALDRLIAFGRGAGRPVAKAIELPEIALVDQCDDAPARIAADALLAAVN